MEQPTIGIIGGGQLGRMLTLAALPLGFRVIVVDPNEHCPAAQVGAEEITADLYDPTALQQLAERADFITVEIEHLDTQVLEALAAQGKQINPAPKTIRLIQDKLQQKEFLKNAGIPVAPFLKLTDEASALRALKSFDNKMLVKTRHGAYDGRGNTVVTSKADVQKALQHFSGQQLYAEAFIPFSKELATMVARSIDSIVAIYPIVETIHARNICLEVLAPAPIDEHTRTKAEQVAREVAQLLEGAGTFGIEMFLTENGDVFVNEIAPRVHNSGHYTIEAADTSQFEQHIRAIAGLPLGKTDMVVPASVMINVLGERNGPTKVAGLEKALATPCTHVHLYGKSPTKIDRKMGHITSTAQTLGEARKRARLARRQLSI